MPAPSHAPSRDLSSPEQLRDLLARTKRIAVVGASREPWRASFGIMRYLQRVGYQVFPVNPHERGNSVHGEPFYGSLREIEGSIDLADVFRRSDAIDEVVEDAIGAKVPVIWLQLGIYNEPACARAEAAGITVVRSRCISVEHSRLMR